MNKMTISFHHYRGRGTTYILGTGCAIEKRINFDDFGMRYDIDFLDFGMRKGRDEGSISNLGGEILEGICSLRKRRHFLKIKRHFFVYCKTLGARSPSAPPAPMS